MAVRPILIFLFATLVAFTSNAQENWSYGVNPYYGAVFKYRVGMDLVEFTNLHGIELYANKLTDGKKAWHKLYNYPQWGLSTAYYNYGDPDLGEVYLTTTYLDLTAGKKRHKWRLNIGTGIVYSTVRFDAETNPLNQAISAKWSYVLRGTIHKEFVLDQNWFINLNLSFRHFSNGRFDMPNNGMNYPIVGFGVRYQPKELIIKEPNDERVIDHKVHYNLRGSISWRQVWAEDVPQNAYAVSFYAAKQVTLFNNIILGIDAFRYEQQSIDKANSVYLGKNGLPKDLPISYDTDQVGLTVGTELLISKVIVVAQYGYYLYKPQEFYSDWYQRYGLKYSFTKNFFAQISLKAHSHTADMVEFGGGITL